MDNQEKQQFDIALIGAGIMSATLATLIKELQPDFNIIVYEKLDAVASESSDAWNNAGTGHSGLCELNYTPEDELGNIDISKAVKIMEQFEISKEFWAYLVEKNYVEASDFIHSVPHMSCVFGQKDVDFLKKRYTALSQNPLFSQMKYSEDKAELRSWIPLMMEGRNDDEIMAATRVEIGTDVNYGDLTRLLFKHLEKNHNVKVHLNRNVTKLRKQEDLSWNIEVEDENDEGGFTLNAKFVFIGAGGGALPLLEEAEVEEAAGYGGFPVNGQWLICKNRELIEQHHAKVYGQAANGAPPMSVPHLDTRIINGKKELLFGPFAGFSTKFLKHGSFLDLPLSINRENLLPLIQAGLNNIELTEYLIRELLKSFDDKMDELRKFVPNAVNKDWEIAVAGQRVQIIKKDKEKGGTIEFGTEIITTDDKTLAALLGASPGASTSVYIMLKILKTCFEPLFGSEAWQAKFKEMIPTYGTDLSDHELLAIKTRAASHAILELDN